MISPTLDKVGLVVIGRNEGERLTRCLASVQNIPNRVYVDSGSTDRSVANAREMGVQVVELPVPPNFTAARARNSGLAVLLSREPELEFVQMVDGDCEMAPRWLETALPIVQSDQHLAVLFGRLRERFPERSIYNALCDDEWNKPIGEEAECGGVALIRVAALRQVGFFNEEMIAGEEPELSMRLRKSGWRLRCIDAEMGFHDAAIIQFRQWWRRARRAGHGYGHIAALHPENRKPNWARSVRSIVAWGGAIPLLWALTVLLALIVDVRYWIAAALLFLTWPLRMFQLSLREHRRGLRVEVAYASGVFLILGKLPQFLGLLGYYRDRLTGRASHLIEHKRSHPHSAEP